MDQYGNLFITYSDVQAPIKIGYIPIEKDIAFKNFENGGDSKFYKTISTGFSFEQESFSN